MPASLTPQQRERAQRLFDEVVELEPEARAARLEQVCGNDEDLRRRVESLLDAYGEADDLLQGLDRIAPEPPPPAAGSASQTGRHISQYDVLERLGAGGMGEVYKAHDTKLGRTVALKFLTTARSDSDEANARFVQEARAASALDHPNIGTIHEIGEADDGQLFIAMAFYSGETLKQKIARGPLPLDEALAYAVQIARGLATAHAQGIVHRDIKPANIMVTEPGPGGEGGLVKIVDFGLAKMVDVQLTRTGATMGTVAYMSPEQARGDDVDHRTDIWAVGVVLYEMLAGERPFRGDYEQALIYSLLNEDPLPVREVNPDVPDDLEHVITMCLEKEKAHRYPAMADVLADLDVLKQGGASGLRSSTLHKPRTQKKAVLVPRNVLAGIGVLATLLLLVLAVPVFRQVVPGLGGPALPDQRFLAVLPFDNVGGDPENQAFIDGLVYTVTSKLTEMEQFQKALSVVPAHDVLQAGLLSTRAAADRFKVNLVVVGSVQRLPSGVRINVQLVDPKKNKVVGSVPLDEPMTDVAALQDRVVFRLAELLEVELNPESEQALAAVHPAVPEAYDFYTQALGYLQRFEDETNIEAAINLFHIAIKEDSSYALAYAGLGEAYLRLYQAGRDSAYVTDAVFNGQRAVDLDDDLATVRVTLGMIYYETGRYEKAELEYRRALALEPNNAAAHHQLGWVYYWQDKPEDAEESFRQAITLKPNYWLYTNDLGQFYHRLGRHQEAIPQFTRVTELAPENPWGYNNVGAQYTRLGRVDEAMAWYEKASKVNPNATRATAVAYMNLAGSYYTQDRYIDAARTYEKAVKLQQTNLEAWDRLGDSYHWAGDHGAARKAWQRAVELARGRLVVNQQDAETLGFLAEEYARLGEWDSTRAVIVRLLALDEQSAETLVSIGKAYEIMEDRAQALPFIKDALDLGYSPAMLEFSRWLDDLRDDPDYRRLVQADRRQEEGP